MTLSSELVAALRGVGDRTPDPTRDHAGLLIADSLAISHAAIRLSRPARLTIDGALAGVDGGSSHIFGRSAPVPPATSAFANSALAHSLDFDDTHDLARLHTTTVTLPAALAVGELVDAPGDRVLLGFILGSEVMCRIGLAAKPAATGPVSLWFLTQLAGYLGAAVTAGIVLDLDDAQLMSAIGFAYSQAAGAKEAAIGTGSDARSIYPAFAASGGVTAALLARAGLRGPASALDGPTGFWEAYLGGPPDDEVRQRLLGVGSSWEFGRIVAKPWPSCRMAHPYIDAVLALPPIDAEIDEIRISVNASAARLCSPPRQRRRPVTLADASFSVPYMTALALAKGAVDLGTVIPSVLDDADIHALADLVIVEQSLPDGPGNPAPEVTVLAGGREYSSTGRPEPVMSVLELRAKFDGCLAAGGFQETADELWRTAATLSDRGCRDTMNRITRTLSPQTQAE